MSLYSLDIQEEGGGIAGLPFSPLTMFLGSRTGNTPPGAANIHIVPLVLTF